MVFSWLGKKGCSIRMATDGIRIQLQGKIEAVNTLKDRLNKVFVNYDMVVIEPWKDYPELRKRWCKDLTKPSGRQRSYVKVKMP